MLYHLLFYQNYLLSKERRDKCIEKEQRALLDVCIQCSITFYYNTVTVILSRISGVVPIIIFLFLSLYMRYSLL